jgi:putative transposase
VSIDPGERKMLTTYSPNKNESLLIGANYRDTILPLLEKLDSLYSEEAILKNEKKSTKRIKQKILLLRKYIHNLKCESVNHVSNLITKSYDKILMPKLDIINLTERAERKLKTKIVRSMLSMRHCELFDKIKFKSYERGKEFMKVKEDYTSQTCFKCGDLKKSSLEIKNCNKCSLSYDRDIVGALNILLKSIR